MLPGLKTCHDCGAKPGEIHQDGCDIERCSVCGGQRLQCECKHHEKEFARWTGIWPGEAEVTESEKLVLKHIKLPLTIDQMSRYMFDANMNMIAETRGWGWIQYKKNAELLQDTLGEMIVKAFNKVYGS